MLAGVVGMSLAVVGTLLTPRSSRITGSRSPWSSAPLIGMPLSRVALTAVPQRTALSHAFGGLAAGLVGTAKYLTAGSGTGELTTFRMGAIAVEVILGFLTFTGWLMAAGKLQELIPTRPITYRGQNVINLSLLAIALAGRRAAGRSTRRRWLLFPGHRSRCRWSSACC